MKYLSALSCQRFLHTHERPLWVDSVEKLINTAPFRPRISRGRRAYFPLAFHHRPWCRFSLLFTVIWHHAGTDKLLSGGLYRSCASFFRFCTVAASRNSSPAPLRPRNLSRSSFMIRLRWANSTSTFLRSLRDWWYSGVPAIARAISRDSSCTLRTIFRFVMFGQQRALYVSVR